MPVLIDEPTTWAPTTREPCRRGYLLTRAALFVAAGSTGFVVLANRQLANQWHVAGVTVARVAYVVMLATEHR